jgi:hypothetical protein
MEQQKTLTITGTVEPVETPKEGMSTIIGTPPAAKTAKTVETATAKTATTAETATAETATAKTATAKTATTAETATISETPKNAKGSNNVDTLWLFPCVTVTCTVVVAVADIAPEQTLVVVIAAEPVRLADGGPTHGRLLVAPVRAVPLTVTLPLGVDALAAPAPAGEVGGPALRQPAPHLVASVAAVCSINERRTVLDFLQHSLGETYSFVIKAWEETDKFVL